MCQWCQSDSFLLFRPVVERDIAIFHCFSEVKQVLSGVRRSISFQIISLTVTREKLREEKRRSFPLGSCQKQNADEKMHFCFQNAALRNVKQILYNPCFFVCPRWGSCVYRRSALGFCHAKAFPDPKLVLTEKIFHLQTVQAVQKSKYWRATRRWSW